VLQVLLRLSPTLLSQVSAVALPPRFPLLLAALLPLPPWSVLPWPLHLLMLLLMLLLVASIRSKVYVLSVFLLLLLFFLLFKLSAL
jgi:hypothetical protein